MSDKPPTIEVTDTDATTPKDKDKKKKKNIFESAWSSTKNAAKKTKEKLKQVADDGIIFQKTRRLSDGSMETTALVAPWGKKRRKSLGLLEGGGAHPASKEIVKPTVESYAAIAKLKQDHGFEEIDKKAKALAEPVPWTVDTLSAQLTALGTTDIDKARAYFAWIATHITYDVEAMNSGHHPDQRSAHVLKTRLAVCEGYSNLFYDLATQGGFKEAVWTVGGWATGSAFDETMRTQSENTAHAWNAIKIANEYHLLDCTWGAGSIAEGKFSARFTPYFFFTPPEQLIHTHFPSWASWQLLLEQITKEQWQSLPFLHSLFFERGLELSTHKSGQVRVTDLSDVKVVLTAPEKILLMAQLQSKGGQIALENDRSFTFHQRKLIPNTNTYTWTFYIRLPDPSAKYNLQVYSSVGQKATSYDLTLDYVIDPSDLSAAKEANGEPSVDSSASASATSDPSSPAPAVPSRLRGRDALTASAKRRKISPDQPFPHQFSDFTLHGHWLYYPFKKHLTVGKKYAFKISKQDAIKMVVIVEGKKDHSEMKLNSTDQTFELEVPITQLGKVKIGVQYSKSATSLPILLEYDAVQFKKQTL